VVSTATACVRFAAHTPYLVEQQVTAILRHNEDTVHAVQRVLPPQSQGTPTQTPTATDSRVDK